MQNFTFSLKRIYICLAMVIFIVSSAFVIPDENRVFIQSFLNKYYDKEGQVAALKRYELNVTNTGFCRYKKVFSNGKEEFFSFNLSRFKSMDFLGDVNSGSLYLRTKGEDVIVQTRNDKEGAVDSMATYMAIPLKNIDVEQLNELYVRFKSLNNVAVVASH